MQNHISEQNVQKGGKYEEKKKPTTMSQTTGRQSSSPKNSVELTCTESPSRVFRSVKMKTAFFSETYSHKDTVQ